MPPTKEELIWKGSSSLVVNFWVFVLCGLFFWLIVPIFIGLWKRWLIKSRLYEVTSERIKITQGIFSRRTDELELYRVRDTTLVQPFLYRMFKKGNVVLNTTDTTTPVLVIECVPDAEQLRDQVRQAVEVCRDRKRARIAELGGPLPGDTEEAH